MEISANGNGKRLNVDLISGLTIDALIATHKDVWPRNKCNEQMKTLRSSRSCTKENTVAC